MPKETTKPIRKPGGWSTLLRQLATWEKPALLVLVKDLYEAAAENRDFVQARCQTGESGGEALEKYRHKMTYVENGAEFTYEYGDIDERFYSSIESALDELAALLYGDAREMYPTFSERLARVEQLSDGIGWGFHDYIEEVVWQLEEELGDQ